MSGRGCIKVLDDGAEKYGDDRCRGCKNRHENADAGQARNKAARYDPFAQPDGGRIYFLRSPVTTEDNSLSISGVMVSSMTESLEDAYKTSRTNSTDKTAAARLLCFILEEMPVITAPARIDAVMGIRGRASMLKTPRI